MQTSQHDSEQDLEISVSMETEKTPAKIFPQDQATYSVATFFPGHFPKEYEGYIYAKWLRSARFGNPVYKRISSDNFFKRYADYIKRLLLRSSVRIAVLDEDKDIILGFSCHEPGVLHYIYVSREQRGQGIAKHLFPIGIEVYSHYTKCGEELVKSKLPHLIFNPFV